MRPRFLAVAGALLFVAGVVAFMGIITAEALYPEGYSTSGNEISDLGATRPPDSIIEEPSATIFNTAMMVCGVFVIAAAYCLWQGTRRVAAPVLMALFGLGVLGVGVFPGDQGDVHAIFAMLTFIAGAVAAIVSLTVTSGPFRYFAVLLGVVSLGTLLMYMVTGDDGPMAGLGRGGVERWVAYPTLMWVTGLGGYLMGRAR
jgi:hypothetical membrane protein